MLHSGLSGPAILPIALRMVWQAAQAISIPVCGIGGIASADDAIKFLLCGASAVQVGTASFANPSLLAELVEALPEKLSEAGVDSVQDLIGSLRAKEGTGDAAAS